MKKMLLLLFAGLLLLAGCTASEAETYRPEQDDSAYAVALESYMRLIETQEYEKMYTLLEPSSRENISEEDFVARNKNIYNGIEARSVTVSALDVAELPLGEGEQASGARSLRYHMALDTSAGEIAFEHTANIYCYAREDGADFRLDWDHSLIFPNLSATDRVRIQTEPGRRGAIYDRKSRLLAGDGVVKSVGIVPGKLSGDSADITRIAEILQMTEENVQGKLNASWVKDDHFVPLRALAEDDIERKEALLEIPGIRIVDETDRVYPYGEATAHLTGYIQSINKEELEARPGQGYTATSKIGKIGLESLLEERIRGVDGQRIVIAAEGGEIKETLAEKEPVFGESVFLTIDAEMQKMLYAQFREDKSAVVVLSPDTGEVLVLMSTPAYDPNQFVLGLPGALWEQWQTDERRPLYNRFKAAIVPGSSFKPIIGALGLTTGAFTEDEDFGHEGKNWQADASWGGYTVTTLKETKSPVSLERAMVRSDNIYFAKAALKIGAERLSEELRRIGFGQEIPFLFGTTASSIGNAFVIESDIETADSGHGQGRVLVNPLHMASMYTAFLHGGDMITPYLEYKVEREPQVWIKDAFTPEAAETVRRALIEVIEDDAGTAHDARIKGQSLAAKTGTAEIKASKEDTTGTEIGWMCMFTADPDAENPLLFVGLAEDVKERGGSHYLFTMAQSVFTYEEEATPPEDEE